MHRTKISPEFDFGGDSWVCTTKNVALGYDVGKIGTGCVVFIMGLNIWQLNTKLNTNGERFIKSLFLISLNI